MGVLNGPEDAGMSNAIAQFLVSVIPESLGRYFAVIIAVISAPGTYLLNNDAFYYGVLPPLALTAQAYGFTDPPDWFCCPDGIRPSISQPAGAVYLPADGSDRNFAGRVPGLYFQMVYRNICNIYGSRASASISSGVITVRAYKIKKCHITVLIDCNMALFYLI